MCESMGGQIEVDSQEGVGTRFSCYIALPKEDLVDTDYYSVGDVNCLFYLL